MWNGLLLCKENSELSETNLKGDFVSVDSGLVEISFNNERNTTIFIKLTAQSNRFFNEKETFGFEPRVNYSKK